jgi:3-deoxy-D-manno-octulosonate 8-phosphate phosphatase (KDO 8-P phosphatase)
MVPVAIDYEKLKNVKMLVLDVDGVLTDCRLWMDSNGEWKRFFSVRDGVGIKRLSECGYKIAAITGSTSTDIQTRVKNLGFDFFYEGKMDKVPAFQDLQRQSGLSAAEIAYVGDEYFDIPMIEAAAFGATVPEAVSEVLEVADYITQRPGGNGAVREVCDLIYKYGAFSTGRS